jgi:hypothetical protein
MVAGDRLNLYHLQQAAELIDVGTWQIALKKAINEYLPTVAPPPPANYLNDVEARSRNTH